MDTALHNPVSKTIYGDRFDEAIREKADNLQALHQVESVMVKHYPGKKEVHF